MLLSGGQDGKMAANLFTLLCTLWPVPLVSGEEEALVPYMKPLVGTLSGAADHCGRVHVLNKPD